MHPVAPRDAGPSPNPVVARLAQFGAEPAEVRRRLQGCPSRPQIVEAKSLLQSETDVMPRPRYLLSGWACRFTVLADGRRRVFDLVLPGEGLAVCTRPRPFALTSVMALTRVELLDASEFMGSGPSGADDPVVRALDRAADADEQRLLRQVVRLGRMTALERLAHFFLDLHDRMSVVGAADRGRFDYPVTQELLADLLGLSTVHVNRMIQELRRQDLVVVDRVSARVPQRGALARIVDLQTEESDAGLRA